MDIFNRYCYFVICSGLNLLTLGKWLLTGGLWNTRQSLITRCALDEILIIGNGPSVLSIDPSQFSECDVLMVNLSYQSELYASIKPRFHMLIDPKVVNGIWGFEVFDEIKELNPEVTFVIPRRWIRDDRVRRRIGNSPVVLVDTGLAEGAFGSGFKHLRAGPLGAGGVVGAAIDLCVKSQFKKIFIVGNECTGFFHEILDKDSHFYGTNSENKLKAIQDRFLDLFFIWISTGNSIYVARKYSRFNVRIVNLAPSTMFPFYSE